MQPAQLGMVLFHSTHHLVKLEGSHWIGEQPTWQVGGWRLQRASVIPFTRIPQARVFGD